MEILLEEAPQQTLFKFKNTWKYREAAIHFERFNCYTKLIAGTHAYWQFWDEEFKRCLEGYTVDNIKISGYHYFYLNYCPIEQVTALNEVKDKTKKTAAKRETKFPKFWDLDWIYFTALDIAEYGLPGDTVEEKIAYYRSLPLDIGLVLEEENISGGKHLLWLKFRGCGASWKGAAIPARNFFFVKESKSYMYADSKEYLNKDGVFTKFLKYKNFINDNTPFVKFTDVKNDLGMMHIRASHKDTLGNEKGFMSEVMGVPVEGIPDKVRGKRGKATLFEEFGTFNKGGDTYTVARSSHEEGFLVFGTMILYGTAGHDGKAFETMEKMFFAPYSFGLLRFINTWDDDLLGTECALFTPADYNVAFVDEEGNTDKVLARKFIAGERAKALKSNDPADAIKAKCEHPLKPAEALLRTGTVLFPRSELLSWKTEILTTGKMRNLTVFGDFLDTKEGVKFQPLADARPVLKYPHDKKDDNSGCISIWETPFRVPFPDKPGTFVPDDLYIICVDPYMHDTTTGDSLGSIYVLKNVNKFSKPDDTIVACYVGRPQSMDIFHKKARQLAQYYNAKIGYENDAGQALLSYFKSNKYMNLLAPEFELAFNSNIPKSSVRRGFGMHMTEKRRSIGLGYLADWLVQEWMVTENGEVLRNYHKIYDVGLLEELIKFHPEANCDRISALIIGMYFMKEVDYKRGVIDIKRKQASKFFKNTLFS